MERVKKSWDGQPVQDAGDYKYVINPLTDQIPACDPELLEEACEFLAEQGDFENADLILGEEDRGGILIPHVSMKTRTPFSLAKWYPSELEGEHSVDFMNGYADGSVYLNGVDEGDRVVIVDDLISTGATMVALIEALENLGAEIVDVVVLCEKPDFGGREKVKQETGIEPKVGFKVYIEDGTTRVEE